MVVEPELGLFAVCDGMGGHAAGEVASQTAGAFLRDVVARRRDDIAAGHGDRVLREAIEGANHAVFELASKGPGRHGMGTTCCALLVHGHTAWMGHVGDSRLYLLRAGRLDQLSEDHNYAAEAIRSGALSAAEAHASPWAGRITRAVGVRDSVAVDILRLELVPRDVLLLCSDGLHQYAGQGVDLAQVLAGEEPQRVSRALVDAANASGGSDNVTAVVVRVPSATEEIDGARRALAADLDALGHVLLFAELTLRERVTVMNRFKASEHATGSVILGEGDRSESLFVVVQGSVEVVRNGKHVARVGAGSHFGEMALLAQRPRSATVTAETDVRLLELPREAFLDIVQRDPVIGAKFLWQLAQILSLRLDELLVVAPEPSRRTQAMGTLSPFRR
jgi:serine/threonine protein phosphatase PrpC